MKTSAVIAAAFTKAAARIRVLENALRDIQEVVLCPHEFHESSCPGCIARTTLEKYANE